jgi:hypothetical protein
MVPETLFPPPRGQAKLLGVIPMKSGQQRMSIG